MDFTNLPHGLTDYLLAKKRESLLRQRGCIVWLTGLSGSGKSTLAKQLEGMLLQGGRMAYVLDGDKLRRGLNSDLGFTPEDRKENIRRISHTAKLLADIGVIVIVALISPYQEDRQDARRRASPHPFLEVHISTRLEECEARDPKGLYKKARQNEIKDFTGITAPYEPPEQPELVVNTEGRTIKACADRVYLLISRAIWAPALCGYESLGCSTTDTASQ